MSATPEKPRHEGEDFSVVSWKSKGDDLWLYHKASGNKKANLYELALVGEIEALRAERIASPAPALGTPEGEAVSDIAAGDAFRETLLPRADAHHGPFPLFYGWAIMDAFLAGAQHARTPEGESTEITGGGMSVPDLLGKATRYIDGYDGKNGLHTGPAMLRCCVEELAEALTKSTAALASQARTIAALSKALVRIREELPLMTESGGFESFASFVRRLRMFADDALKEHPNG